jgi:hypothetical protein
MWFLKGTAIMLGFPDPNLFIPAQLFFALGLLGLHACLRGWDGWPTMIGGFLAYAAVALSVLNTPYSLLFEEDRPQTPFPFNVTYGVAALSIFVGLVLLGIAAVQAAILPPRWRALPLVIGLSALLPVWVLAFIHLELPVVLLGLGWMLLGYALWSRSGAQVEDSRELMSLRGPGR